MAKLGQKEANLIVLVGKRRGNGCVKWKTWRSSQQKRAGKSENSWEVMEYG